MYDRLVTAILFLDEVRHIDVSDRVNMVGVKSQFPPPKPPKKVKAPLSAVRPTGGGNRSSLQSGPAG